MCCFHYIYFNSTVYKCICCSFQNNDDDRKLEKRLEVIQGSDGSGIHRKLRLGPGLRNDKTRYNMNNICEKTWEI